MTIKLDNIFSALSKVFGCKGKKSQFFCTPSNSLWLQLDVLKFNSILTLSNQIPQLKVSVPQDCCCPGPHTHILQTLVASPGYHLCFWPTSYRSEVTMTPSLGSINLLKWITDPRGTLMSTSLWKDMIKDTDEQPDKEIHRAGSGRVLNIGASVPMELRCVTLPVWCVYQPENSPNLLLGFYGGFLT